MIKMFNEERLYSFSSANTFPMKILLNPEIINIAHLHNRIPSIHYQLNPTNECNFNCPICSCSEREREKELSMHDIDQLIKVGYKHGMKSVTITGGGEPLLHPNINEIIRLFNKRNIEVGLVTNGSLLERLTTLDNITWIRISVTDYSKEQFKSIDTTFNNFLSRLSDIINNDKFVDWSFSYVIGKIPDIHLIKKIIDFATDLDFTHVRIVNDIFIADELSEKMKYVEDYIKGLGMDDSIVNYQDRSEWTKGYDPCYLSILKPVIGADGYIYPCCGTQYALEKPSRDYEKLMRMGHINNLENVLSRQWFFDGSICHKCYYGNYNRVLKVLMKGLKHKEFV